MTYIIYVQRHPLLLRAIQDWHRNSIPTGSAKGSIVAPHSAQMTSTPTPARIARAAVKFPPPTTVRTSVQMLICSRILSEHADDPNMVCKADIRKKSCYSSCTAGEVIVLISPRGSTRTCCQWAGFQASKLQPPAAGSVCRARAAFEPLGLAVDNSCASSRLRRMHHTIPNLP